MPATKTMTWADYNAHVRTFGADFEQAIALAEVSRDEAGITYDSAHHAWVSAQAEQVRRRVAAHNEWLANNPEAAAAAEARLQEQLAARGRALWTELHQSLGVDLTWLNGWLIRLPCGDCRTEAEKFIADLPPDFGDGWFAWGVAFHNSVNGKLGKPRLTLEDAAAIWGK